MARYHSPLSIIKRLSPTAFDFEQMSKEDFIDIAWACNGYWMHNGDPAEPHATLMTGFCSNGYLNLMRILQHSNLSQILARQMVNILPEDVDLGNIDWVVGSAYTATGLSKDVANLLGAQWAPLQKNDYGMQVCSHAYLTPKETILHVEDVITTGKSLLYVNEAIRRVQPLSNILRTLPVVAFRPLYSDLSENLASFDVSPQPLFEFNEFWVCPQAECVLCQQGSKPLKPKVNWALFSNT